MRAVVTGCAGFIGSHLCEALVADGVRVTGVDAFTAYYPPEEKRQNLAGLAGEEGFELVEADLAAAELGPVVAGADVVYHLAAQPGVRESFRDFARYTSDNLLATQRVLAAAHEAGCRRVVWASSSSVYGDAAEYPCREEAPTAPRSPYGVTKRACEDLAAIYRAGGLATVGLRFFTVYGPRQRPDMAMRRLADALLTGSSFPMYGDGGQSRDFTYVGDAVGATIRAAAAAEPMAIYNVGGGEEATLATVVALLEELTGREARIDRRGDQAGDVRRTAADTTRARRSLGWSPATGLRDGLTRQVAWQRARTPASGAAVSGGAPTRIPTGTAAP